MKTIVKVSELEIVHTGKGYDGYGTYILTEGKEPPNCRVGNGVDIYLIVIAYEPVRVTVSRPDSIPVEYWPTYFKLDMGDIKIQTHPQRFPCQILVGSEDLKAKSVRITFAEGRLPWVEVIVKASYPKEQSNAGI